MDNIEYAKQLLHKFNVYPENIKSIAIEADKRFLGNYSVWVTINNWREQHRYSPFIKLTEFGEYEHAEELALTIEFGIVPDRDKIKTFYCKKRGV